MSEPKTAEVKVLPDIASEGERIVRETYKPAQGGYLWTDVVGAVQTAIAEERARHAAPASPPAETGEGVTARDRLESMADDFDTLSVRTKYDAEDRALFAAARDDLRDIRAALSAQQVSPSEGGALRRIGQNITMSPFGEDVGNAVISPEEPQGPYWTLIAQGGEAEQNAIGDEIVRRLNATHPASDQSDTERMRKARVEVELVGSIARAAQQDFDSLEAAWPASKRGSRAQKALDSLKDRISGMEECAKDASAALAEKAAGQ